MKKRHLNRLKNDQFRILKSEGYAEGFSKKKLLLSLQRSGLPKRQCQAITDKVAQEVEEGSNTRTIYRKALRLVNQNSPLAAVNYSLKRAIFELGPTGHHFETFVARYFEHLGFKTKTCQVKAGRFVNHEIDVVASKGEKNFYVECKFHNRAGIKNDIKIALYVKARRDDLKEGPEGRNLKGFYLASNTAFSLDAIKYANGSDLHLLGVNAPPECSFLDEIKAMKLYPVTSLKRLNRHMKNQLLDRNIVLAKELAFETTLLAQFGLSEEEIERVLDEVELLNRDRI